MQRSLLTCQKCGLLSMRQNDRETYHYEVAPLSVVRRTTWVCTTPGCGAAELTTTVRQGGTVKRATRGGKYRPRSVDGATKRGKRGRRPHTRADTNGEQAGPAAMKPPQSHAEKTRGIAPVDASAVFLRR